MAGANRLPAIWRSLRGVLVRDTRRPRSDAKRSRAKKSTECATSYGGNDCGAIAKSAIDETKILRCLCAIATRQSSAGTGCECT